MCGPELAGSTVGIVGLGQIGQAVMQRLRPFGVARFLYCGRTRKEAAWEEGAQFVPFEELLAEADFVLVTCSYSPELHHMFSVKQFGLMKSSAILVNTSRGGAVDQVIAVDAFGG
jgi:lactate dehydrogenase-like 2-hydroxyacid dehydrogenase